MDENNEWHDGSIVNLNLFWHYFFLAFLLCQTGLGKKEHNKKKKNILPHGLYMASREKKMSDDTNRRMCIP